MDADRLAVAGKKNPVVGDVEAGPGRAVVEAIHYRKVSKSRLAGVHWGIEVHAALLSQWEMAASSPSSSWGNPQHGVWGDRVTGIGGASAAASHGTPLSGQPATTPGTASGHGRLQPLRSPRPPTAPNGLGQAHPGTGAASLPTGPGPSRRHRREVVTPPPGRRCFVRAAGAFPVRLGLGLAGVLISGDVIAGICSWSRAAQHWYREAGPKRLSPHAASLASTQRGAHCRSGAYRSAEVASAGTRRPGSVPGPASQCPVAGADGGVWWSGPAGLDEPARRRRRPPGPRSRSPVGERWRRVTWLTVRRRIAERFRRW